MLFVGGWFCLVLGVCGVCPRGDVVLGLGGGGGVVGLSSA